MKKFGGRKNGVTRWERSVGTVLEHRNWLLFVFKLKVVTHYKDGTRWTESPGDETRFQLRVARMKNEMFFFQSINQSVKTGHNSEKPGKFGHCFNS